jgi:hypothetical protein
MLKAEICKNRIQLEGWDSRDDLLAKLRNLCGSEPDEVTTLRTGEPDEYEFKCDDGSKLSVDFLGIEPHFEVIPPTKA